jgi:hypothetical protein
LCGFWGNVAQINRHQTETPALQHQIGHPQRLLDRIFMVFSFAMRIDGSRKVFQSIAFGRLTFSLRVRSTPHPKQSFEIYSCSRRGMGVPGIADIYQGAYFLPIEWPLPELPATCWFFPKTPFRKSPSERRGAIRR